MGQKVNPIALRLGITQTWPSKWFASRGDFATFLEQDIKMRKFIKQKVKDAGIDTIEISRDDNTITIDIIAGKPGIIIGRGGSGIEDLKKAIRKDIFKNKFNIKINVKEVKDINLSAAIVLQSAIADIEKRMPFRRVMKQSVSKVMRAGAKGVKISAAGRLNGVEIARTEVISEGKIPLHTLRANIDYSRDHASTTYGKIGVKVWIYKGEVFNKDNSKK
jgi:small subunit ribosomal protein S3